MYNRVPKNIQHKWSWQQACTKSLGNATSLYIAPIFCLHFSLHCWRTGTPYATAAQYFQCSCRVGRVKFWTNWLYLLIEFLHLCNKNNSMSRLGWKFDSARSANMILGIMPVFMRKTRQDALMVPEIFALASLKMYTPSIPRKKAEWMNQLCSTIHSLRYRRAMMWLPFWIFRDPFVYGKCLEKRHDLMTWLADLLITSAYHLLARLLLWLASCFTATFCCLVFDLLDGSKSQWWIFNWLIGMLP